MGSDEGWRSWQRASHRDAERFRAQGLGFRVLDLGFTAKGLGLRV